MTGNDILRTAMTLMGYTDAAGNVDGEAARTATRHGLAVVRQIYAELAYAIGETPIELVTLSESIPLPHRLLVEVMPYGVATLLAISEGDNNNEAAFAILYNRKRGLVTLTDKRVDVLPR